LAFETSALSGVEIAKETSVGNAASFEVATVDFKALSIETERVNAADNAGATAVLTATETVGVDVAEVSLSALSVEMERVSVVDNVDATAIATTRRGESSLSLPNAVSIAERFDAAFEEAASTSVLEGGEFATDRGADVWSEIETALVAAETSRKAKRRDPFESFNVWGDDLENLGEFGF
jgi:hypothetical protein